MARLTLLCAVGLVLAVASCSHALRFPSDAMTMFEELPKSVVAFQGQASSMATKPSAETAATEDMIKGMLSQGMYSDLEAMLAENENVNDNKGQGKGRRPIQIVTKFFVKPGWLQTSSTCSESVHCALAIVCVIALSCLAIICIIYAILRLGGARQAVPGVACTSWWGFPVYCHIHALTELFCCLHMTTGNSVCIQLM